MQAPNWTRDGKALIYNSEGKLYRFDLATTARRRSINTGFATANNNDHVLSFDGKMLGISHQPPEEQRRSIVYTLPVDGRHAEAHHRERARRICTAGRRTQVPRLHRRARRRIRHLQDFRDGGEEIRLTDTPGLDDGPEYSPDGKYIYFNSRARGRMQIWRMKPDGSEQEQLTNDEFNNWFPHLSPDGKSIVVHRRSSPT